MIVYYLRKPLYHHHHSCLTSAFSHRRRGWMDDDCPPYPSILGQCSSTPKKFISSITQSLHFFLAFLPAITLPPSPPTLTSPTPPNIPPLPFSYVQTISVFIIIHILNVYFPCLHGLVILINGFLMVGVSGRGSKANHTLGAYDVKSSRGKNEHQYQKLWQHWQQHHQVAVPVTQQPAKVLYVLASQPFQSRSVINTQLLLT